MNTLADALSQPNGQEDWEPIKEVSLIPPEVFLRIFGPNSTDSVETRIIESQARH